MVATEGSLVPVVVVGILAILLLALPPLGHDVPLPYDLSTPPNAPEGHAWWAPPPDKHWPQPLDDSPPEAARSPGRSPPKKASHAAEAPESAGAVGSGELQAEATTAAGMSERTADLRRARDR